MTNDDRDELLLDIRERLVGIESLCEGFRETVSEHHLVLDGTNGDAGLKSRVKVLETCAEEVCRKVGWLQVVAWSAVTGSLVLCLAVIGWMIERLMAK